MGILFKSTAPGFSSSNVELGNRWSTFSESETERQEREEFLCNISENATVKVVPTDPPKFDVGDPTAAKYLEENGYVVFRQVATPEEVVNGINLFWKLIESETKGKVLGT